MNTRPLALLLLVASAALVHSRIWPRRVCRVCADRGETGPSGSTARRTCWRCGGSRRVARFLAWVPLPFTVGVVVVTVLAFVIS